LLAIVHPAILAHRALTLGRFSLRMWFTSRSKLSPVICDTIPSRRSHSIRDHPVTFTPSSIAALIVAASFAAGLNVYATVATLGLLAHLHWVTLPLGLQTLSDPWIIVISSVLFAVEIFADKIPGFDLFWNAAHTFIRVPVAALLAYQTASQLSPQLQLLAAAAGAVIAAIAHTSKTAARALVTPSPEPISNITLSASEDVAAISLTWVATHHPYTAAAIATVALIFLLFSLRWIATRLKRLKRRLFHAQAEQP